MSYISKPVDWEVFNIPPIQTVQYYSILKKKREFSQLIRQYDAQVFKHGYLHYCGIVPKNISSLNNKYELIIVFFDEVPNTSFIGFRVKVSKESFVHESNALLLFLKKSKKAVFYLMNNNCIHVQCGTNAWELFYLLYDIYLRQYVLTLIGTQFFYHFVYSYCIQKEIQLLEILFKGSKIIRVSKKSIYYKIHRKRKISVTDLIYMTLNMPKSKRCILSSFNSKETLYSDFKDGNFYSGTGNKIHVSKLVLKKFKMQFQDSAITNPVALGNGLAPTDSAFNLDLDASVSKYKAYKADTKNQQPSFSNTTSKRKVEEIESEYTTEPNSTASKFLKVSKSASPKGVYETHWEQYTNFKPYNVNSYSQIPCLKHLVPNLLNNDNSSRIINSDSYLFNNHSHTSVPSSMIPSISLVEGIKLNNDSSVVEEACEITSHIDLCSTTENNFNFETSLASKGNVTLIESTNVENNTSNYLSSIVDKKPSSITFSVNTTKNYNDKKNKSEDGNFTTAAGKNINISNTAMQSALRLFENLHDEQPNFQKKVTYEPNTGLKKLPNYNPYLTKKRATGDVTSDEICVEPSHGVKSLRDCETTFKKLDAALSDSHEESFVFDNSEDVSFSTAAGKTINVSNAAMQAAQKLIQDVFKEENRIAPTTISSYGVHKKKVDKSSSAFKDIGCPSKKSVPEEIDVAMDKTLVEKFFEDTLFDEKELEGASEFKKDENTSAVLEPKNDQNLPTYKPKKSLGGRRSMRFCSDTLH